MNFGHVIEASDAERAELALALGESATRCHGFPPFDDLLAAWSAELGAGRRQVTARLDDDQRKALFSVLRLAAGRAPNLGPLTRLLAAVEAWAFGERGFRQPLPAGDGDEPGWSSTSEMIRVMR
jgi:hypothetical protein